jgi:hypothetical protein
MNKKELMATIHTIQKNHFYADLIKGTPELKTVCEKRNKFKFLSESELNVLIQNLINFDPNNLWDKKFWGLKVSESICAVATEPANYLSNLRKTYSLN